MIRNALRATETRGYVSMPFEVRALDADDEAGTFDGQASTPKIDDWGDRFMPGAWKRTIKNQKGVVPILHFHAPDRAIGLTKELEDQESAGLYVKGALDLGVEAGRDNYSGLRFGYIDRMSVGFTALKYTWRKKGAKDDDTGDEFNVSGRDIKEARLWEVSLVTRNFAANDAALVNEVRSAIPHGVVDWASHVRAELQAGRALSGAELDQIEKARSAIGALLDAAHSGGPTAQPQHSHDDAQHSEMISTARALVTAFETLAKG
jgi:HK97 family phage prohead protease